MILLYLLKTKSFPYIWINAFTLWCCAKRCYFWRQKFHPQVSGRTYFARTPRVRAWASADVSLASLESPRLVFSAAVGSLPVDLGQPWRASITAKGMRMEGVPRYSASTAGSMNVLLMESSYLGARSR